MVTINRRQIYLGKHGTADSKAKYDALIGEYLSSGRTTVAGLCTAAIAVAEVFLAFMRHADGHYRKEGQRTSEFDAMRRIVRDARRLYGDTPAAEFGPLRLESVRKVWIDRGLTRQGINKNTGRLKHIFRWAGSKELVPVQVYERLALVESLQMYRSPGVAEAPDEQGVSLAVVEKTIPHLSPIIGDMVRIQLLTGARPGEICKLTPGAIDCSAPEVWEFDVEHHKMAGKKGRERSKRTVYIGPEAQEVLRPYLDRADDAYCFSPADNDRWVREQRRLSRTTPISCGNRAGTNRKARPKKQPGDKYEPRAYQKAIERVCKRVFIAPEGLSDEELTQWRYEHIWCPKRLRHTKASEIRKQFGPEAAQVILGHKSLRITEIYAAADREKAREVARKVG